MSRRKMIVVIIFALVLVFLPLLLCKDAEFGGSDDEGSQVVAAVDSSYQPWAAPLFEKITGRELPGEVETLFFCLQTGIGVGIIAFIMGRMVERKKWRKDES